VLNNNNRLHLIPAPMEANRWNRRASSGLRSLGGLFCLVLAIAGLIVWLSAV
jgi:hypothetical protein